MNHITFYIQSGNQIIFLYPSAFKLLGIIPNVALILENSLNCRDISNSHLKVTVGICQKVAKSKQSGIHLHPFKIFSAVIPASQHVNRSFLN